MDGPTEPLKDFLPQPVTVTHDLHGMVPGAITLHGKYELRWISRMPYRQVYAIAGASMLGLYRVAHPDDCMGYRVFKGAFTVRVAVPEKVTDDMHARITSGCILKVSFEMPDTLHPISIRDLIRENG